MKTPGDIFTLHVPVITLTPTSKIPVPDPTSTPTFFPTCGWDSVWESLLGSSLPPDRDRVPVPHLRDPVRVHETVDVVP